MVLIPGGGSLTEIGERFYLGQRGDSEFTLRDYTAFFEELDAVVEMGTTFSPPWFRSYFVTWSYGGELDKTLLELWLQRIHTQYVLPGHVEWGSLRDIYDDFSTQRNVHRTLLEIVKESAPPPP